MRIVFAGSPEIAVSSLELVSANFDIVAVLTNPDKITGRGRNLKFNPVKNKAVELGLNIIQSPSLDVSVRNQIEGLKPDLLVVFAYGKIFGPKFLALFPLGGINVHPSLLPMYRGSSPIISAILNGDNRTGISIQRINSEMDTGAILNQHIINLDGTENTESLSSYVSFHGSLLLLKTLNDIDSHKETEKEQDKNSISYCRKLVKEDGLIQWNDSAVKIDRQIRAYNPWPGAYSKFNDKKLMFLKGGVFRDKTDLSGTPGTVLGFDKSCGILIQTGDGILFIEVLQLQNKKANNWKSFINGTKNFIGSVLGGE